jgi:membrane associated rhomboid family serine protease
MNNNIKELLNFKNNKVLYYHASFITLVYIWMIFAPQKIEKYVYLSRNSFKRKGGKISFILNNYTHQDFDHYFGNITLLIIIGLILKNKINSMDFFITFTLSGIASNFIPYFKYPNSIQIGSSGSIYGLLGYNLYDVIKKKKINIIGIQIAFLFLTDIYGLFTEKCDKEDSCTLHSSHLSGALLGFLYTGIKNKLFNRN